MKKYILAMLLLCASGTVLGADEYYWRDSGGNYSGNIDDGNHWYRGNNQNDIGTVPGAGARGNFKLVNQSYTIKFPEGVYTNFARMNFSVYPGKTVEIDGRNTLYLHPENPSSNYETCQFAFNLGSTAQDLISFHNDGAKPTPSSSPNLAWTNFYITANRPTERDVSLTMDGGVYNFLTPCGFSWQPDNQKPYLYFFSLNANNQSISSDLMDNISIVFNNSSLLCPVVGLQGNANTNILKLVGGSHKFAVVEMPAKFNGGKISERPTYTEFTLDGATVSITNTLNLVNWTVASQRIERIVFKNKSKANIAGINMTGNYDTPAKVSMLIDSSDVKFGLDGNKSQNIYNGPFCLVATNGASIVLDHKGNAPGANGHGMDFGCNANTASPTTPICHFFSLYDSVLDIRPASRLRFYGANVLFENSLIRNSGNFYLSGNASGLPLSVVFDGSVFTNSSPLQVALNGPVKILFTNSTSLVTSEELRIAGGAEAALSSPVHATIDIVNSSIQLRPSGKIRIGEAGGASATANMYSGKISDWVDSTIETFSVGFAGIGEFNLYGGEVDVFLASVGTITRDDYNHTKESLLRIYGGEMKVRCAGNGEFLGLVVGSGKTRKGRLALKGGNVTAYTICGGLGAICRGGSGYAAFESDGGTVTAIATTPFLIHDFDSATVGEKGLTIDSNGYNITVPQSLADASDANGTLYLKGEGVKTMSGDLSKVSNVVLSGGAASFSSSGSLRDLTVRNSSKLVLNPSSTLVVDSLTLDDFTLALNAVPAIGNNYDLVKVRSIDDDSISKWQKAYITSQIPEGSSYDLTSIATEDGTILRLTVRENRTVNFSLESGEQTQTDDYIFGIGDTLETTVGEGADLTLSGAIGRGMLIKNGAGVLRLTNGENIFMPGFLLAAGAISLSDISALSVGPDALLKVKHGVLEVLGPAVGASIDREISMVQESTNDIFVIKNEVDLTMKCPVGNGGGEFIKRGVGRLTWTVDGAKTITGGKGYGRVNNNHLGWAVESICQLTFDEKSGMVTSSGVWPLTIAEGELRIVGVGNNAKVTLKGSATVGTSTKVGSAQPGLVLDNVIFEQPTWPDRWMHLSPCINYSIGASARSGDFVTDPYILITNNAHFKADTVQVSRFGQSSNFRPRIYVDGSTFEVVSFHINRAQANNFTSRTEFKNNSKAFVSNIYICYDADVIFDNSILAKNSSLENTVIVPETANATWASGRFTFLNGSKLYCSTVSAYKLDVSKLEPLKLTFDDSQWIPASTNFVFEYDPQRIKIVSSNVGLRLPVPAGKIWTMNHVVTGTGGLVNDGEGTLLLGPEAVGYSGVTIAEGNSTIDLGGCAHSVKISGSGRFENGDVSFGGVSLDVDDNGISASVPTIASDISFSGSVKVSIGRTAENALKEPYLSFDVLKYEGDAPNTANFRLRGTGVRALGGMFAVDSERKVVVCTPMKHGSVITVR